MLLLFENKVALKHILYNGRRIPDIWVAVTTVTTHCKQTKDTWWIWRKHPSIICSLIIKRTPALLPIILEMSQKSSFFMVVFIYFDFLRQLRLQPLDAISWRKNMANWIHLLSRQPFLRQLVTRKRNRCFIKWSVLGNE